MSDLRAQGCGRFLADLTDLEKQVDPSLHDGAHVFALARVDEPVPPERLDDKSRGGISRGSFRTSQRSFTELDIIASTQA